MVLFAIIFFLLASACFVITVELSLEENHWAILTGFGFVVFLFLLVWSINESNSTHTIPEVKTVQIDTVITTCKGVSDTTYVIHYVK